MSVGPYCMNHLSEYAFFHLSLGVYSWLSMFSGFSKITFVSVLSAIIVAVTSHSGTS